MLAFLGLGAKGAGMDDWAGVGNMQQQDERVLSGAGAGAVVSSSTCSSNPTIERVEYPRLRNSTFTLLP